MLKLTERYPDRSEPSSANYPYGGPKDDPTSALKGTPWEAATMGDLVGMMSAIVAAAKITPTGNTETAIASDILDALCSMEYYEHANYKANKSIVTGSDGNRYIAKKDNGPTTSVVNPVGDNTRTWVMYMSGAIGQIIYTQSREPHPMCVRANGGYLKRSEYPKLWQWANNNQLVIAQETKDRDQFYNSSYYGTGDGLTTFTVPDFHQGQVLRGSSSLGRFLETQGDAIRNITGLIQTNNGYLFGAIGGGAGALRAEGPVGDYVNNPVEKPGVQNSVSFSFDASRAVPTANENRMKVSNIYIDIYAG